MSKHRKIQVADTRQWSTVAVIPLNWDLCILCQTKTREPLICPDIVNIVLNLWSCEMYVYFTVTFAVMTRCNCGLRK